MRRVSFRMAHIVCIAFVALALTLGSVAAFAEDGGDQTPAQMDYRVTLPGR